MKTLGKDNYILQKDFYYLENKKFKKVEAGQEYVWNGFSYSPVDSTEKKTLNSELVENDNLFKTMEEHLEFIFGIYDSYFKNINISVIKNINETEEKFVKEIVSIIYHSFSKEKYFEYYKEARGNDLNKYFKNKDNAE